MIFKSKILRDTFLLTVMQLFLDMAALVLNVFITKQLGASAMGILSLIGSFLGLAGILSNGNAFLCTSRLVSEELGKKNGDPDSVLKYGIRLCIFLSIAVSVIIAVFAEIISLRFFSGVHLTSALRLMPFALVSGAVSACLKGYFNACRRAAVTAVGDIAEFLIRCTVIVAMTLISGASEEEHVCRIMIWGIIAGNVVSLILFSGAYVKLHENRNGRCSLSFRQYTVFSLPIMGGSVLTAVLSSTNDALIPICLRQYGDTAGDAFSKFGIFEAIVIPTLFFPSVVLCSMSGIIVSEAARAKAEKNKARIKALTEKLNSWTLMFSVFAAAVLMRFGRPVGELLGGGELAGKMITVIAPVIPFIYMEIVLEAIIKGMGLQSFSSINYLAEYIIRIAAVLILIPRIGFYGIVISYYASNIIGNCARFIKVTGVTGAGRKLCGTFLLPVVISAMTMSVLEMLLDLCDIAVNSIPEMVLYTVLWGSLFFAVFCSLGKVRLFDKTGERVFVDTAQHMDKTVL